MGARREPSVSRSPPRRRSSGDRDRSPARGKREPSPPPREERSPEPPRRKEPGPRGAVKVGDSTEPPEYVVEEVGVRNSGDKTYQAVLNIKGEHDRVRSIRAPPRTSESEAGNDGADMKNAFMENGLAGVREWQQKRRRGGNH